MYCWGLEIFTYLGSFQGKVNNENILSTKGLRGLNYPKFWPGGWWKNWLVFTSPSITVCMVLTWKRGQRPWQHHWQIVIELQIGCFHSWASPCLYNFDYNYCKEYPSSEDNDIENGPPSILKINVLRYNFTKRTEKQSVLTF